MKAVRWALLLALVVPIAPGQAELVGHAPAVTTEHVYGDHAAVGVFIDEMVKRHDYDRALLKSLFKGAARKQTILDAIARPAERRLVWHEYRAIFMDESRIRRGVQFWEEHQSALADAYERFGVPPEIIVAIIGVETRYGRVTGGYRVLDALSTLAFDYPPRSDFFRSELEQFLLLTREERRDATDLNGSYAGAMGYGQFIPSSFRNYAIDFDDDGHRDIWANPRDAIGSVANYFARHGWQTGAPVTFRVSADPARIDGLTEIANAVLKPDRTVGDWKALGLGDAGLAPSTSAALFRMENEGGPEFWLGLDNFYVITRYNHSRLYAMAVYQLAQAINQRRGKLLAHRTLRVEQDPLYSFELIPPGVIP